MNNESILWQGKPSLATTWFDQLLGITLGSLVVMSGLVFKSKLNIDLSTFAIVFAGLTVWALVALAATIIVKFISYKVTNEKLIVRQGVFNRRTDIIELYRIKDFVLLEPLAIRLMGKSNLEIESSDRNLPSFTLKAIPNGHEVMDIIRKQVEAERERKKAREIDMQGSEVE
ncbi:putative bPH_2 domain-containing protein [Vibrio chagasii]|nr:putative bPH_2 domain-containing protein [Vibrio chagasii]